MMTAQPAVIRKLEAFCYRYPLATPVVTSFGRMLDRPAVFVRIEDDDGIAGFGEAWCNFPSVGAEHRTRIIKEILAPALIGTRIGDPAQTFDALTERFAVLALQSGEFGPFAQAIAGVDLALWDLHARRAKQPLWRMLGSANATIKVYASGINPTGSSATAEAAVKRGYRALKLKIGFDADSDRANLAALRSIIGSGLLATDANQGWSLETARAIAPTLQEFDLAWLEEPIRADRPWDEWRALKAICDVPLAAGENITSRDGFEQVLKDDTLSVVQPDIAKWGGLSLCSRIARKVIAAGKTFCPHYLGGGIGLLASAHLLAGVGGDGLLEVDANDNPLRNDFCGPVSQVADGTITLGGEPGLGITPDLASIERYRTA